MAKAEIPLAGSDDRGDNKFEKAEDTGSQTNYYVGDRDTGLHCHMWVETDTGKAGVEHRGQCSVDDDKKTSERGSDGK